MMNYTLIKNGEFAYNKSYSKDYPLGAIKMLRDFEFGALSTLYIVFKSTNINSDFLESYYQTNKWHREIMKIATEGARNHGLLNISANDFFKTNLYIPKLANEQIQISEFVGVLDNLITLYQRKIKVLNHLKYSYLSNMLSDNVSGPILRFSYYNSNWRNYLLGDIGRVYSGIGFPENEQGGKSGIPFYKISDMNTKGNETELFHSNNYVTKIQIERNKWKVFEKNIAIMFAKVGAAIMLNRKRIVKPPFLIDNNSMIYLLNDNWDYRFAKFLFDTLHLPKYAQVGALPSYNASEINGIKVCIPDVHEQKDIGNALFLLEKMSKYNSLRLLKILNLKKSYFNYLFI